MQSPSGNRSWNLISLAMGAAGVSWSGPEYRWIFELIFYAAVAWAVFTICWQIVARGRGKALVGYALLMSLCAMWVTALSFVAANRDWGLMTAVFRTNGAPPVGNGDRPNITRALTDNSSLPVIDQSGGQANIGKLQTNGNGTFLKQSGGTLNLGSGSATFPGAKFPASPLTPEESALTNDEIRNLLRRYGVELTALDTKLTATRDDGSERDAIENEFKSLYLERGRTLKSLIVSRTKADPDDLPDKDPDDPTQMLSCIKLGRSSLGHGKIIRSPICVMDYLNYLAESLRP
jgi:hypothetical protein